jgi:hypothetical protein
MLQYWTTWNYIWWLSYKNNRCELSPALRSSIIATSIVGGYMVYIYPRNFIFRINKTKYIIPYCILITGDFFFHQYPLLDIMSNCEKYSYNTCAKSVVFPFATWYSLLSASGVRKHKIYGINLHYLIGACAGIGALYGLKYHARNLICNK